MAVPLAAYPSVAVALPAPRTLAWPTHRFAVAELAAPGGTIATLRLSSGTGPVTQFAALQAGHSPCQYVEVSVAARGTAVHPYVPAIAIGLSFNGAGSEGRLPGWDAGTIAFHSDDGKLYDGADTSTTTLSAPWHDGGGIAGVGILPPDASHAGYRLLFTMNGAVVCERPMGPALDTSRLRWAVGIIGSGTAVYVNPGAAPYAFAPANALLTGVAAAPAAGAGGISAEEAATIALLQARRAQLLSELATWEKRSRALDVSAYGSMPTAELLEASRDVYAALSALRSISEPVAD